MSFSKLTIIILIITALIVASFCESPRNKSRRKHKKEKPNSLTSHAIKKQSGLANIVKSKASGGRPSYVRSYGHGHLIKHPKNLPVQNKGSIFKSDGPKARRGLLKKYQRTRNRSKFLRSNMNGPRTRSLKMARHRSPPVLKKGTGPKHTGHRGKPSHKNPSQKGKSRKTSKSRRSTNPTQKQGHKKGSPPRNGVKGKSGNYKPKSGSGKKNPYQKKRRHGPKWRPSRSGGRKTEGKNQKPSNSKMEIGNSNHTKLTHPSVSHYRSPPVLKKGTGPKHTGRRGKPSSHKNPSKNQGVTPKPVEKATVKSHSRPKPDTKSANHGKPSHKSKGKGKGKGPKGKRKHPPYRRKPKKQTSLDTMQGDQPAENAKNETVEKLEVPVEGGSGDGTEGGSGDGTDKSTEETATSEEPKPTPPAYYEDYDDKDNSDIVNNYQCRFESGPMNGKCMKYDDAMELLGKRSPGEMAAHLDLLKAARVGSQMWVKFKGKTVKEVLEDYADPAFESLGSDEVTMDKVAKVAEIFTGSDVCGTVQDKLMLQDWFYSSIVYDCPPRKVTTRRPPKKRTG